MNNNPYCFRAALTYLGAIPFVVFAALHIIGVNELPIIGETIQVLCAYIVIIGSFLAGSYWGQHLSLKHQQSKKLALFSNIAAVFLWVIFISFSYKVMILTSAVYFAALLAFDKHLYKEGIIQKQYYSLRCRISFIVIATLIIVGVCI